MAQRQSHSLSFLSLSLFSALALVSSPQVAASAVSTSVFPNSACAGASSSTGGLVGIGSVTLSTGEVETHCGCPSDNLPSFEACPSSASGESVCNSILDLESGAFTASCSVVACQGSSCPTTVVNTVVIDSKGCYAAGTGSLGFSTLDGESKCGCSSEATAEFTSCPSPANGRPSCIAIDSDFLGLAVSHKETVQCGVVCDEGFYLTPGGACTQHGVIAKRQNPTGASGTFNPTGGATAVVSTGASQRHGQTSSFSTTIPVNVGPTGASQNHRHHHLTSSAPSSYYTTIPVRIGSSGGTTTSNRFPGASQYHHHHSASPTVTSGSSFSTTVPVNVGPSGTTSSSHHGASQHHHHHHHSSSTSGSSFSTTIPVNVGPSGAQSTSTSSHTGASQRNHHHASATTDYTSFSTTIPAKFGPSQVNVGPSQRARRSPAVEEVVFGVERCESDERSCPSGDFGDMTCVRLDDVNECGGCASLGESTDCMAIPGIASAVCLRGGCVVRSCEVGFVQSGEGACTPKA